MGEMRPPPLPMRPPPPPMHPPAPNKVPMHPPGDKIPAMGPPPPTKPLMPPPPPRKADMPPPPPITISSGTVVPSNAKTVTPVGVVTSDMEGVAMVAPLGMSNEVPEVGNHDVETHEPTSSKPLGRPGRPYTIPEWSQPPGIRYKLEVLKEGLIVDTLEASEKGAYMFGRHDSVDFILDHPSISRFHAVLQYNGKGDAFLYDLGSTHGTSINKLKVKSKVHAPLRVGDMIRFGLSTRFYILQGPQDLMPKEGLLRKDRRMLRQLEALQSQADEEASLARARLQEQTEGASWGMDADAVEEEIRDEEEITWQTYKGQLNEKQEKNLEQITKRNEKLTNLKKEIDAIQVKENSQGGLTQGQQTQIARNEKRIEELLEQLESLEETLNDSIRESVLGRKRTTKERKMKLQEEDGDVSDDEFYDRTRKKQKTVQEAESAVSLLEKIKNLEKEAEYVRLRAWAEDEKRKQADLEGAQAVDPLDAFMTDVSTKIVEDAAAGFKKELERIHAETERLQRLLKVADPTGDATRTWERAQSGVPEPAMVDAGVTEVDAGVTEVDAGVAEVDAGATEMPSVEATAEAVWMGAPRPEEPVEPKLKPLEDDDTAEQFVHYKDRKTKLGQAAALEQAKEERDTVEDDIALLLRHKKGLTSDPDADGPSKKNKRKRRTKGKKTLGPDRPEFLEDEEEVWVPPQGQTGDGKTALNEKFGY